MRRYVISLGTAIEVSDRINFDSCQAEDQRDVNRGQHITFLRIAKHPDTHDGAISELSRLGMHRTTPL